MKVKELQDAVNTIQIKEDMQKEMIRNIKDKKGQKIYRMRKAAAAALIVVTVGAVSIPVSALVNSVVQERMEKLPQEELNTITEEIDHQRVEAGSESRAYTETEKSRMEELYQQYQTGVFPEGELLRVDSVEEAQKNEFCFLVTDAVLYLPDRELTDEELLEIIDFNVKKRYALEKRYEEDYADEIAAQKEKESRQIAETVEAGGITEEEAVEIAKGWLARMFDITGEGLEMSSHFSDDIVIGTENEFYEILWHENSYANHQYGFYIHPQDGSLVEVIYCSADLVEEECPALSEADSLLPGLSEKAISFMEDRMQLAYEDVYYAYYICDDKDLRKEVKFSFVQEDGTTYSVIYSWEGTFMYWREKDFESEKQSIEEGKETIKQEQKFLGNEVDVQVVFEKL